MDLGPEYGVLTQEVRASGSFESQNPTALHFGLGSAGGSVPVNVRVYWPEVAEPQAAQVQRGYVAVIRRTTVSR